MVPSTGYRWPSKTERSTVRLTDVIRIDMPGKGVMPRPGTRGPIGQVHHTPYFPPLLRRSRHPPRNPLRLGPDITLGDYSETPEKVNTALSLGPGDEIKYPSQTTVYRRGFFRAVQSCPTTHPVSANHRFKASTGIWSVETKRRRKYFSRPSHEAEVRKSSVTRAARRTRRHRLYLP